MKTTQFKDVLTAHRVIPLDGAWGTELTQRGLSVEAVPERWNLERPEIVAEIPRVYAAAGARIVLTNTFGGSALKLAKAGLAHRVHEINAIGVKISKDAVGQQALVFASVGPIGDLMEPYGTVSEQEVESAFTEQIKAQVSERPDGIVIETMTDLTEALCALRAAKSVISDIPVVVSMTFDKGAKRYATMMGVTPAEAARRLDTAGADIIGTNCGHSIGNVIEIVRELRRHTRKPIWAKVNAGIPQLVNGVTVFPDPPEFMAAKVPALIAAGATMIGGCCGTTPDHIRAIARACSAEEPRA